MNTFAEYILEEEDLAAKMEILYYLSKKARIFYDKSIIFRVEIARMFLNYSKIDVDKNTVLTAMLLCNCKKIDNAQEIEKIRSYAKEGAQYLETLGFNKRFCKICEEVNRYSGSNSRERESDIIELVDQFGGMLLNRPERIGFKPDEALVLLEHRNLKDQYNRYLETFIEFVNFMEEINIGEMVTMTALRRLVKIFNEAEDITKFIKEVVYNYEPKVDGLMSNNLKQVSEEIFAGFKNPNRPLFSEETAKKIINHMNENSGEEVEEY